MHDSRDMTRLQCFLEVSRNEELSKLRRLHDTLVSTRQQVAGCTDPDASNFDINASVRTRAYPLVAMVCIGCCRTLILMMGCPWQHQVRFSNRGVTVFFL